MLVYSHKRERMTQRLNWACPWTERARELSMPVLLSREAKIASSEHMRIGGSEEMAWLQICEPTEKDKGKYTFEIFDGKDNHQRSLDLSGQGMRSLL